MTRRLGLCAFCLALALPGATAGQEPESNLQQAKILLRNRQVWDVEIVGRFRRSDLLLRRAGQSGNLNLPVADIFRIDFPTTLDKTDVYTRYYRRQYDALAQELRAVLDPVTPYVSDINSNLTPLYHLLLKTLYWQEDYATVLDYAGKVLERTRTTPLGRQAVYFNILALAESGRHAEAAKILGDETTPERSSEESPMYWYAMALVRFAEGNLFEGQECAARVVAFHAKDMEWMPAALCASAQGYARAGRPDTATQVIREIRVNFPRGPWFDRAAAIAAALPPPDPGFERETESPAPPAAEAKTETDES